MGRVISTRCELFMRIFRSIVQYLRTEVQLTLEISWEKSIFEEFECTTVLSVKHQILRRMNWYLLEMILKQSLNRLLLFNNLQLSKTRIYESFWMACTCLKKAS